MRINDIKVIAKKLYEDIELNGIEAIKKLFLKGTNLSENLRVNLSEEYIKKILICQMNIGRMVMLHKYYMQDWDAIPRYRKETERLRRQICSDSALKFDEDTIDALFGNSLNITSIDDYEEWKEFTLSDMHNGVCYDTIYFEEEFKYNYENEKNVVKKFIKSFRYKKIMKNNALEDVYVKKVREMLRKEISENPGDTFIAYSNVHKLLEKGVAEYEGIKEIEDLSRMTLIPFISQKFQGPINIQETCKSIRSEMKNKIGTTRIGEEYRQRAVTLGAETGISKRPIIQTIPFEEIPRAMEELQKEYEEIYNNEQNTEEYIKGVTKIYADFIFMQPYDDGNKRTALCLLNSMLMSKNIIPPIVSLINDDEMIEAYYKAYEKDYTMLQKLVIEKCFKNEKTSTDEQIGINRDNDNVLEEI